MAEPLGSKIGSAFIEVGASFADFGSNLAGDITNAITTQGFVVGQALENFGQAVFTKFSLPLIAATGANIAQFQALDREIRTVLTLFGTAPSLVEDTFSEMAAGVRGVSEEVGGLEKDISEGLYQAISAGVPRGGVFEFLDVAQMAAIADRTADLTTAVDGLTTVINAFGLESTDAERAADVMFQTVALGKTTFGELSQDIGRVAPLAANAGVSFEELFAIIGALTLQGLKTSEAISFLRASITGLLRPTDELNAVFAEAGFTSAEAAVPIIGLQEAFQTVFDAVGGSTSQMQELIGTSEGVSAILGVTGDNADTFGRIMGGVENSTGAATRAFEIMDESVGRSFGKLTEAFDRLGNTFGEMASQFATPVLETATGVINRMVDIFSNLRPIVGGLAQAFGSLFSIFNVPVIREIVAIFAVLVTTVFGLIGSLGLFALTIGKVILAGLKIKTVATIFRGLNSVLTFSSIAVQGIGESMVGAAGAMRQGGVAAQFAARPVGLLGKAFQSTRFATLAAGAAFAGIGIAIAGAIAGIGFLINKQKEYVESQEILRKGVDQLLESLGLVNQEITLAGAEEGETTLANFRETNREALKVLQDTNEELGTLAAQDLAEALAVEFIFRGNSPEDVLEAIGQIEQASGIKIDLDLSDLQDADRLIEEFNEGLEVAAQRIGGPGGYGAQINNTAEGILTLFQRAFATGDVDGFVSGIEGVRNALDELPIRDREFALDELGQQLNKIFQEEYGFKIAGFFTDQGKPITDPQFFLDRLAAEGFAIEVPITLDDEEVGFDAPIFTEGGVNLSNLFPDEGELTPFTEQIEIATQKAEELGISVDSVFRLGEEGLQVYQEFAQGITGAFEAARTEVESAFEDIRSGIESQNPLLDVYSGKIDQSFEKWQAGQQQFREDLESVTALREQLVGDKSIPQEFVEAFDRQPISKQAWLAGLGEADLQTALEELSATFELIDDNANERILQSFDDIMVDAQTIINDKYGELQSDAQDAGPNVANAFEEGFDTAAPKWVITANRWMAALIAETGRTIPGPTVGPITFSGGSIGGVGGGGGGNTYNTTINNPVTESPETSASKVNAINRLE